MLSPSKQNLQGNARHDRKTQVLMRDANAAALDDADNRAQNDKHGRKSLCRPMEIECSRVARTDQYSTHRIENQERNCHDKTMQLPHPVADRLPTPCLRRLLHTI